MIEETTQIEESEMHYKLRQKCKEKQTRKVTIQTKLYLVALT